jgi:hypothetical protein
MAVVGPVVNVVTVLGGSRQRSAGHSGSLEAGIQAGCHM